jgi:hypothetical protein
MRKYLISASQQDARLIVKEAVSDVSHILRDTAYEVLPLSDMVVDERLLKLYLQSIRISKFASNALKIELRRKRMWASHKEDGTGVEGVIQHSKRPLHIRKETIETLLHLLPLKISMTELELGEALLRCELSRRVTLPLEYDAAVSLNVGTHPLSS